ncbi:MAG: phage holin family protein [Myxococcales bacterium]|nr:phage holin family protein [Myxococcales bacterium]
MDADQLRSLSTPELLRHAVEEARLLARAEVLHAKAELKEELGKAKLAGLLLGAAASAGLSGLSLLFVALAVTFPLPVGIGPLLLGALLLALCATLAFAAYRKLPKRPLPRTQQRLREDFTLAKDQFA